MRRSARRAGLDVARGSLLSRRQVLLFPLAGMLASLGAGRAGADAMLPAQPVPVAARPRATRRFTAAGSGDKDGRDWNNAMPLDRLARTLASARPGSAFLIGFEPESGAVPLDAMQIPIRISGDRDDPILLQAGLIDEDDGVAGTGRDAPAYFTAAKPWSLEDFGRRGASSFFALADGASHLRISGFRIEGAPADGFLKFRGKRATLFEDIVISAIDARKVGRVIETERGARLHNLTLADCRAVGIVRGFARFRDISDSTFRNLELDAANMDAGGRNVCQLLAVTAGENLLFENVTLRNALNQPPPKKDNKPGYVQGDGIVCERNTRNVTIRNCHASGMGDGGFDLKTANVTIENCSTDSCKFGARIWKAGDNVIRRSDFRNPVSRNDTQGACIQAGGTLEIVDCTLHAGPGTAAVSLSHKKDRDPPHVVMRGGAIRTEGDGRVAAANGEGVLELHNVVVNGTPTTHRYIFEKKKT